MATATVHFFTVGARTDREVTAYLYSHSSLVATGSDEHGKPKHVIAVTAEDARGYNDALDKAFALAVQQRDRLASGLIFGGEITEERPVLSLPEVVEAEVVEEGATHGAEVTVHEVLGSDVEVGDWVIGKGKVLARSVVGVFFVLLVREQRWSLADGTHHEVDSDLVVHPGDSVLVHVR